MEELERHIAALNAALEAGDFARAAEELKACDLERLVRSRSVSPALREMIDRALATAQRAKEAREAELIRLAAAGLSHRVAEEADRRLVIELLSELFDEVAPGEVAARSKRLLEQDLDVALRAETVRIFILSLGGAPVGIARVDLLTSFPAFRLREDHRCGYVDQMFVRPAHRGRKLGKLLLQLCEAWLRGQGVPYCMLHAAVPAQGFYAGLGYQPTRELFKKL